MELDWDCFLSHPFHREDLETPSAVGHTSCTKSTGLPRHGISLPSPQGTTGLHSDEKESGG